MNISFKHATSRLFPLPALFVLIRTRGSAVPFPMARSLRPLLARSSRARARVLAVASSRAVSSSRGHTRPHDRRRRFVRFRAREVRFEGTNDARERARGEALDGGGAARAPRGLEAGTRRALASERRGTMMSAWKWAR